MGLGLLFVLIPTVNLVNINISRIMERASEIGVRKAFGAPARTLVGQFLIENILLTIVGGLVGFVLSIVALRVIDQSGSDRYAQFTLNPRVFAYGMAHGRPVRADLRRLPGVADVAAQSCRCAQGRRFPMTRHLLRLIWNRKRQNFLLTLEIFFSFLDAVRRRAVRRAVRQQLAAAARLQHRPRVEHHRRSEGVGRGSGGEGAPP